MNLKKALSIAIITSILGVVAWELYWRSQGYVPTIDDNKALWAIQRDRLNTLAQDDVVLMGSSRILYGIQLDAWEKETGKRPIQLANVGSSPLPVFHDIVENTNYAGTVILGVAPGLFFSTTYPKAQPWAWWTYYIRLDIMLRDLGLHKLTLNHEKKKQKLQPII
ncbi:MAG: hypothetical protein K9I95_14410 [Flavobacteriaceae bacterium]|nr:hypothetical protein [Flavobacteriaceae bacterium]